MNIQSTSAAIMLTCFLIGSVHAAGSPMNESFATLVTLSEKAVATGKSGDVQAFSADTEAAFKQAKEQNTTANSPAMQRIAVKLRAAMNAARDGKIPEGTALLEEALANMKEGTKPAKFGGGS